MYKVALFLFIVLLVSCVKQKPERDERCEIKIHNSGYIGIPAVLVGSPDLCCEQNNFGWIKIQNTSIDTFYRPYGLGVWTYYPGTITKERYFNSVSQQAIEIYRNEYYNGNIASYSSMIYSAPNEAIICDTIFVNL